MKAARYYGARDLRIEDIDLGPISESEVRIKIEWCGICGSDKHLYASNPRPGMVVPLTMGHEFTGTVIEAGKNVTRTKVGDRVVVDPLLYCGKCWACTHGHPQLCEKLVFFGFSGPRGAFAEETIVDETIVYPISDKLSFEQAGILEPTCIAMHALRISKFRPGDNAIVFGAGPIGLLQVSLLRTAGATNIIMVGHHQHRLDHAMKLGATLALDPDRDNVVEAIKDATKGGADVAFEISGAQQCFTMGMNSLKALGEMVVVSLSVNFELEARNALHNELKVLTSQCTKDEFPIVADMMAHGLINTDGIITKKILLDNIAEEGFETLHRDKSQLKILVTPNADNLK